MSHIDKRIFDLIGIYKKDVEGQIIRNANIFNQLHQIENLVIIGYSFSDIDNPYLEHIIDHLECPLKAIISTCHSIEDRKNAVSFLDEKGLFDKRYRFVCL